MGDLHLYPSASTLLNFYSPAFIEIQNELLSLSFGVGIFLSELLKEVPV